MKTVTPKPAAVRELFAVPGSRYVTAVLNTPGAVGGQYDYVTALPCGHAGRAHGVRIGAHLGRRLYWADLPEPVQKGIAARLT